eukprot:scaffold54766_cov20-Prasinocladus_malaysianus.AAC.2
MGADIEHDEDAAMPTFINPEPQPSTPRDKSPVVDERLSSSSTQQPGVGPSEVNDVDKDGGPGKEEVYPLEASSRSEESGLGYTEDFEAMPSRSQGLSTSSLEATAAQRQPPAMPPPEPSPAAPEASYPRLYECITA